MAKGEVGARSAAPTEPDRIHQQSHHLSVPALGLTKLGQIDMDVRSDSAFAALTTRSESSRPSMVLGATVGVHRHDVAGATDPTGDDVITCDPGNRSWGNVDIA